MSLGPAAVTSLLHLQLLPPVSVYLPAVLPTTLCTTSVPFQHCFSVLHLQPLPDAPV